MQLAAFCANVPCTFPPQRVPAMAQQMRPPYLPPLHSCTDAVAAGHTPSSAAFAPPGWRPHCFISQQFVFKDGTSPVYTIGKLTGDL